MTNEFKYWAIISKDFEEQTKSGNKIWMQIKDPMRLLQESNNYIGHSVTVTEIKKTDRGFFISGIISESDCRCRSVWSCECDRWRQKRALFCGEFVVEGECYYLCEEMIVHNKRSK